MNLRDMRLIQKGESHRVNQREAWQDCRPEMNHEPEGGDSARDVTAYEEGD